MAFCGREKEVKGEKRSRPYASPRIFAAKSKSDEMCPATPFPGAPGKFPDGQNAPQKTLSREPTKIRRAPLQRFCPAGANSVEHAHRQRPLPQRGKAADARTPQSPFPRVRCVFATGWHAAAREQQTHTSSPGAARTLPRRGKQRRPQAPIPNFPISTSPSPQAPDPQIYLKFPSSKFRIPKAPSPRPQNAAGGRPLLVDLPPSVPARSLHSE